MGSDFAPDQVGRDKKPKGASGHGRMERLEMNGVGDQVARQISETVLCCGILGEFSLNALLSVKSIGVKYT